MKSIEFDPITLKVISDLSKIVKIKDSNTHPIKITKNEEGIHIKAGNAGRSVVFTLDAPSYNFKFESEDLLWDDNYKIDTSTIDLLNFLSVEGLNDFIETYTADYLEVSKSKLI